MDIVILLSSPLVKNSMYCKFYPNLDSYKEFLKLKKLAYKLMA